MRRCSRELLAVGLAVTTTYAPSVSATEIEFWCERLSAEERDELDARVQLTLKARPDRPPKSIAIACDQSAASVLWDEPPLERIRVVEQPDLVEGVIEAIDRRLKSGPPEPRGEPASSHAAAPTPRARPEQTLDTSSPQSVPEFDAPRPASTGPREPTPDAGGVGLRITAERLPQPGVLTLGPQLDIGVGLSGPFVLTLSEGARFGVSDAETQAINLQGGLSWGAPYAPTKAFGASLMFGAEWFFIGLSTDTRVGALAAATASLGVRGALRTHSASFWLGLDGVARAGDLEIGPPVSISIPNFSAVVSLGGVLLVRSGTLGR